MYFDDDPLGIAVKERARKHRDRYEKREGEQYNALRSRVPSVGLFGPARMSDGRRINNVLPDIQWEGFKQALFENTDKVADDSVGQKRGMFPRRPSLSAFGTDEDIPRARSMNPLWTFGMRGF